MIILKSGFLGYSGVCEGRISVVLVNVSISVSSRVRMKEGANTFICDFSARN